VILVGGVCSQATVSVTPKAISPQALATAVCVANSSLTADAVLQLERPLKLMHTSKRTLARLKLEYTITASTISTKRMPNRTGFFMPIQ
jgi:hypothetical protein